MRHRESLRYPITKAPFRSNSASSLKPSILDFTLRQLSMRRSPPRRDVKAVAKLERVRARLTPRCATGASKSSVAAALVATVAEVLRSVHGLASTSGQRRMRCALAAVPLA
jgi:hypothetical protein